MAASPFTMEVTGFKAMKTRLKALDELDAPEIVSALGQASRLADREVGQRAPGSMAGRVTATPAKKLGATIVKGVVKHPGAKAMEFGRTTYYTGYHGRDQKAGSKVKRPGQRPRPFVGIKTGQQAMGALRAPITQVLLGGIVAVWERPETD